MISLYFYSRFKFSLTSVSSTVSFAKDMYTSIAKFELLFFPLCYFGPCSFLFLMIFYTLLTSQFLSKINNLSRILVINVVIYVLFLSTFANISENYLLDYKYSFFMYWVSVYVIPFSRTSYIPAVRMQPIIIYYVLPSLPKGISLILLIPREMYSSN